MDDRDSVNSKIKSNLCKYRALSFVGLFAHFDVRYRANRETADSIHTIELKYMLTMRYNQKPEQALAELVETIKTNQQAKGPSKDRTEYPS